MPPNDLKNLWAIFKVFCSEAMTNNNLDSGSITSFLGWLEHRDEIGNSRYTQGVTDGYINAYDTNTTKTSELGITTFISSGSAGRCPICASRQGGESGADKDGP